MPRNVYHKSRREPLLWGALFIVGVVTFGQETDDLFSLAGVVLSSLAIVLWVPFVCTLSIVLDDDGIEVANLIGSKVLCRHKRVQFDRIRHVLMDSAGNVVILAMNSDVARFSLRHSIRIAKDIRGYRELIHGIVGKVNPVVIDEAVKKLVSA
jgi:hypothetical protein